MDEERYEQERDIYKNWNYANENKEKKINYRLMSEDEIPSWFR
jgi:hypothetical protein